MQQTLSNTERIDLLRTLSNFTGTNGYYKYLLGSYLTDGTAFLVSSCGAGWLIDILLSVSSPLLNQQKDFLCLTFTKDNDGGGVAVITDSDSNTVHTQAVTATDFLLDAITVYAQLGSIDGKTPSVIILLPSEN